MPIWRVPPAGTQPALTLVRWGVMETADGHRHLVGYCLENAEGRVSTVIESVSPATHRVRTRSGRVYRLSGPPGHDPDADYVWSLWACRVGISYRDVTEVFVAEYGWEASMH